jgi:HK97 family phage major capsid protein
LPKTKKEKKMKTSTQYKEDIKNLMKKVADIDAKATAENREVREDEVSLKNEILDTVEELNKSIITMERQERVHKALESPAAPKTVENRIVRSPDAEKKDRFSSFGQQMVAVVNAARPGGSADPRLFNAAASGLNETVQSDGGFLVQQDFVNDLLKDLVSQAILAPKCRPQPISGAANSIKINGVDETSRANGSRQGGIQVYMADEADEKTKSKPKFRKIELNLHKMIGLCYATDELLADAAALEGYIRAAFPAEFAFYTDDLILRGTGVGQPLGILNAGSLVTVNKEAGQKADTIVAENVIKMSARIFASSYLNSNWYVNQMCLPQLYTMSIAVGTGGQLVFVPPGGISGAPYGSLLGRPVIPIEQASALGDVGDIMLADMSGYILAEKGGVQSDVSIHVRFVYDESVFRFVLRIDGQPVRASVLTPYKGGATATQSHFVVLEGR